MKHFWFILSCYIFVPLIGIFLCIQSWSRVVQLWNFRFLFRSIIKGVLETHADVNESSAMVRIQRGLTRNVLCEENTQHLNKVYLVMI